jgi:hypothetical protein
MTGLVFTKFLEAQKKLCEFHSRMQIRFQNTKTLKLFIQGTLTEGEGSVLLTSLS